MDCISDIYCYRNKSYKNTDLLVNIIYYTIVFLPLIIGMSIGAIYGKKWQEDKYKNLIKPDFYPPSYLFGIVWPILYLMIGLIYSYALYDSDCTPFGISKCGKRRFFKNTKYWIIPILALIFNFSYIPAFFSENGLLNGFIIIILSLVFAILTLIQFVMQINYYPYTYIWAILALIPYIAWLSYASYLSYHIYILNDKKKL